MLTNEEIKKLAPASGFKLKEQPNKISRNWLYLLIY